MNPIKLWNLKTFINPILAVSPETSLRFSQTRPRFLKNHETNPAKLWNLKKFIDVGVWDLGTPFGSLGPRRRIQHKSWALAPIFTNKTSFFKFIDLGTCGLEITLWPLGPRRHHIANLSRHMSRTLAPIFTNKTSFFSWIIRWIQ